MVYRDVNNRPCLNLNRNWNLGMVNDYITPIYVDVITYPCGNPDVADADTFKISWAVIMLGGMFIEHINEICTYWRKT